jgi:hypothetical protein
MKYEKRPLYAAPQQPAQSAEQDERAASPTSGMTLGERIAHVGGRTNAAGYIEFGSVQAVNALVEHVLRDARAAFTQSTAPQPAQTQVALTDAPRYREWLHLTQVGMWTAGVPTWARDHDGRMNDGIATRSVIEELALLLAAQPVSGGKS